MHVHNCAVHTQMCGSTLRTYYITKCVQSYVFLSQSENHVCIRFERGIAKVSVVGSNTNCNPASLRISI